MGKQKKKITKKKQDLICPVCMHGVFMLVLKYVALVFLTGVSAIGVTIAKDIGFSNFDPIILWCFLVSYVTITGLTIIFFFYSKNRNMFETMSGLLFIVFLITVDPQIQRLAITFGLVALVIQVLSAFQIDVGLKINQMEIPFGYISHTKYKLNAQSRRDKSYKSK